MINSIPNKGGKGTSFVFIEAFFNVLDISHICVKISADVQENNNFWPETKDCQRGPWTPVTRNILAHHQYAVSPIYIVNIIKQMLRDTIATLQLFSNVFWRKKTNRRLASFLNTKTNQNQKLQTLCDGQAAL